MKNFSIISMGCLLAFSVFPGQRVFSEDLTDSEFVWTKTSHLGFQLHYSPTFTQMSSANNFSKLANSSATLSRGFDVAHGLDLSLAYITPWGIRAHTGASGLYDLCSLDFNTIAITGHAWAVTVPILVGYQYRIQESQFMATADLGIEIMAAGGLSYTSDYGDSSGLKIPSVALGGLFRIGVLWQPLRHLAVTLEGTYRILKSGELELHGYKVNNPAPVILDYSGFGVRVGILAVFF
jgi:hypothetical protein